MIPGLKTYPEMKDSGVDALGPSAFALGSSQTRTDRTFIQGERYQQGRRKCPQGFPAFGTETCTRGTAISFTTVRPASPR